MLRILDLSESSFCTTRREPNKYAQKVTKATGKPPEACWCMPVTFSAELLAQVPAEAQNKACVCAKCAAE